jgi:methionyl-tRNA synthetase
LWQRVGIEFDEFVRTTELRHHVSVQELYRRAKANGYIYKGEYSAGIASRARHTRRRPIRRHRRTAGLRPQDGVVFRGEYFFKLSAFQDKLLTLTKPIQIRAPETG